MNKLQIVGIGKDIALISLKRHITKISAEKPFPWASGTYNPIYNDNRMFLFLPEERSYIVEKFIEVICELEDVKKDREFLSNVVIAGTSTAGISWAALIADALNVPMIYIRERPKDHGKKNQIEGIDIDEDLGGKNVILIEDLISTGKSSVSAVAAIRKANGVCNNCVSIFNYGLPDPQKMFAGKIPYIKETGEILETPCKVTSMLYYDQLLKVGIKYKFIKKDEEKVLLEWMSDQPNWGANHGFPPYK